MKVGAFADFHAGAFPRFADDRLAEQEQVLAQAVEVFNEAEVDVILFGGDATHKNRPSPAELLAFVRPLLGANAPILGINGNAHDVGNLSGPIALDLLNRDLYGPMRGSGVLRLSRTPELLEHGDLRVATLPWAPTARLVASQNGGDREAIDRHAAEHLLSMAAALRSKVPAGCASVLLTHFAISGDQDGLAGLVREPVLPVEALEGLGYDAVISGHFHRPQVLNSGRVGDQAVSGSAACISEPEPAPILFCGSPYPLNFGEEGYDHGCWLLDVEPGHAVARFVPLSSRGFVTVDVDLSWLPAGVDPTGWLIGHVEAVTA